jgi:hypothetical protein
MAVIKGSTSGREYCNIYTWVVVGAHHLDQVGDNDRCREVDEGCGRVEVIMTVSAVSGTRTVELATGTPATTEFLCPSSVESLLGRLSCLGTETP